MTLRHLSLVPLLLATLLLLAACAGNTKNLSGPTAPSTLSTLSQSVSPGVAATATPTATPPADAPGEESAASLEAQIAALAVAEGQLDQVLGKPGSKKALGADKDGIRDEGRPTTPGKAGVARAPSASPPAPPEARSSPGGTCAMACSALASMSRAVARLCSLAGEGDRRCEDGRTRERSATQRVHASCPSCGG